MADPRTQIQLSIPFLVSVLPISGRSELDPLAWCKHHDAKVKRASPANDQITWL